LQLQYYRKVQILVRTTFERPHKSFRIKSNIWLSRLCCLLSFLTMNRADKIEAFFTPKIVLSVFFIFVTIIQSICDILRLKFNLLKLYFKACIKNRFRLISLHCSGQKSVCYCCVTKLNYQQNKKHSKHCYFYFICIATHCAS
jgi:hypothetical protein